MSSGYQKLVIVGNLGTDPESRVTPSGQQVTNFSVAVNSNWNDANGEAHEETTWFRVSVWGNQADVCARYLTKGRQVLVEGKLSIDKETGGPRIWQDQNGKARASFELKAYDVRFLGSASSNGNGSTGSSNHANVEELTEDEIPF